MTPVVAVPVDVNENFRWGLRFYWKYDHGKLFIRFYNICFYETPFYSASVSKATPRGVRRGANKGVKQISSLFGASKVGPASI